MPDPLVIYSWKIDPLGVLNLLGTIAPHLVVAGFDENWSRATVTLASGYFRQKKIISFSHDPAYYTRPDWPEQLRGMQLFYTQFPHHPQLPNAIACLRFAIAVSPPTRPDFDLTRSTDDRRRILFEIVGQLDGLLVSPRHIRDRHGKILAGPEGPHHSAKLPELPA
jgi:hypothetical protein